MPHILVSAGLAGRNLGTVMISSWGDRAHAGPVPADEGPCPRYRVMDTRGPCQIGSSPLSIGLAVIYLIYAVLALLLCTLFVKTCVAQMNETGRGITIRKVILVLRPSQTIHSVVVAGLGPAIHEPPHTPCRFPWMTGTRPGKTIR
jgi:hypothetical protein